MITLYTLKLYINFGLFFICMNLHSCFENKLGWFQFRTSVSCFVLRKTFLLSTLKVKSSYDSILDNPLELVINYGLTSNLPLI
jgi:hypothetical protein